MHDLVAGALLVTLNGGAGQMLYDQWAAHQIAGNLRIARREVSTVSHTADGPANTDFLGGGVPDHRASGVHHQRRQHSNDGANGRRILRPASPDVDDKDGCSFASDASAAAALLREAPALSHTCAARQRPGSLARALAI